MGPPPPSHPATACPTGRRGRAPRRAMRTARGALRRDPPRPCGRGTWPAAPRRPPPLGAAELRQRGALAARVPRDSADLLDRHVDSILALERQLEEVAFVAG